MPYFSLKVFDGRQFDIEYQQTDTIKEIQKKIEEKTGIPIAEQKLIVGFQELNPNITIDDAYRANQTKHSSAEGNDIYLVRKNLENNVNEKENPNKLFSENRKDDSQATQKAPDVSSNTQKNKPQVPDVPIASLKTSKK